MHKYFNIFTNWTGYVSPLFLKILPFSGQTFMHIIGIIEIVASAWLVAIVINLVSKGMFFDVAVRDVRWPWRLLCWRA